MKLLPAPPDDLHVVFCRWSPKVAADWQRAVAEVQQVSTLYRPGKLNPAPDYMSLMWLRRLEYDAKCLWSPVWGTLPTCGLCGLTYPRLEVVVEGTDYFRWVIVGQQSLIGGRFAMVFTDTDTGADGSYHFGAGAGVWRVSEGE